MGKITSKAVKLVLLGILVAVVPATQVLAEDANKRINTDKSGVAIKGYDTVAYFTEGHPVKGKKEFEFTWQDARWRFSSAANRALFATNPERYTPKYGGF